MNAARVICTWLARLCLLAVPVIIVCALVYPAGLAPLDSAVCPAGLTLDNRSGHPSGGEATSSPFRVVCESSVRLVDVTGKVLAVAGVFFLLAVGFYLLRNRLTPAEFKAPASATTR